MWVDEGVTDVREEAAGAASRAATGRRRATPRRVDADVSAQIHAHVTDRRRAERLVQGLAEAQSALDGERFADARRAITPLRRQLTGVAAVHEVAGLVAYRQGRWHDAVAELEAARALGTGTELLPVLADSYRALRRWDEVERIWATVREVSPGQDVLAEARIVAAGAHADRGDLPAALLTMAKVPTNPKRVRDHHLRQWYMLGDLHDRVGDPVAAVRWFQRVADHDADFVDVRSRLRSLGR